MKSHIDQEGIAWAVINRPEKRNAWNSEVSRLLADFVSKISDDKSVLGLVITGEGDYFSSGVDLREILEAKDRERIYEIFSLAKRAFEEIIKLEKPAIAAVNGPAYGLAVELTHVVDYVIASRRASFTTGGPRVGLIPPVTLAIGWINIGVRRASYLAISSVTVNAEDALRIGLVDEIVDHSSLEDRARSVIREISKSDPGAVSAIKKVIAKIRLKDIEEGFRIEAEQALKEGTRKKIAEFLSRR